jgi:DNA-binding LytR/AlgR family response regulator
MPLINGFDLLDGLKTKPQIIFITSKADYAIKAFDYEATDFLHKPISKERFIKAVKKATELHALRYENHEEQGDSIVIKSNLKKLKVYVFKIKWIEAYGDYIKVITDDESHLVLSTMKGFEKELPEGKFIRVHKSYIINLDRVEKFNSKFAEIGTTKIPLSRNKKEEIVKAIENA